MGQSDGVSLLLVAFSFLLGRRQRKIMQEVRCSCRSPASPHLRPAGYVEASSAMRASDWWAIRRGRLGDSRDSVDSADSCRPGVIRRILRLYGAPNRHSKYRPILVLARSLPDAVLGYFRRGAGTFSSKRIVIRTATGPAAETPVRRHWRRTENIPETGPMRNHPADSRAESAPALECLERPKFHQGHSATNRRDCGRGLTQPENIRTSEAVKQRQSDGPEKGSNPNVCGAFNLNTAKRGTAHPRSSTLI